MLFQGFNGLSIKVVCFRLRHAQTVADFFEGLALLAAEADNCGLVCGQEGEEVGINGRGRGGGQERVGKEDGLAVLVVSNRFVQGAAFFDMLFFAAAEFSEGLADFGCFSVGFEGSALGRIVSVAGFEQADAGSLEDIVFIEKGVFSAPIGSEDSEPGFVCLDEAIFFVEGHLAGVVDGLAIDCPTGHQLGRNEFCLSPSSRARC